MQDTPAAPASAAAGPRRPRLNLQALGVGGGERKRGKSMFGVLVNTLNKAKAEDKERSASEAAKKRMLIEQRLQSKLKKETDIVRQIEEAKKDKITASRKEEDLQLKDSIHKFRRSHLTLLSNFLLTEDVIPPTDTDSEEFNLSTFVPKRSHPPPLYYLPAVLLPRQEAFLTKRRTQVKEAVEKEWEQFKTDRTTSIEEITTMRKKVASVLNSRTTQDDGDGDNPPSSAVDRPDATSTDSPTEKTEKTGPKDTEMDVDENGKENGSRESQAGGEKEKQREGSGGNEDDDAVEY
ncbi:uncharacterized protein FOMMEDRAFT_74921 [Fomitiporia mediterranea MF3/22]|uniref:uncharacterized protein n=1 Tax=Fomitiporia mediterranea (strain MF3/22) TaxID=694068 RepID=UPI0004407CA5|nr:uncharacterized protein FOMMEDRAFT_74921 [Fomitiporia mediterranea MF3/22]EJD08252.1 hypothetical protein FOMMEDRAFT_74921 [Fomitiporia mediterranea MF3/22]